MRIAWSFLLVATVAFAGCAASEEGDGDDLMLRVHISGSAIAALEVVDRAEPGALEDDLRPQLNGDIGVIWTDYATGETLADGWMPAMPAGEQEFYLVVPAPSTDGALLTVTLPTDQGPFVLTSYFGP